MLAHETHQMTRKEEKAELIYKDESYNIIGACFAGYKDKDIGPMFADSPSNCELPPGWREAVEKPDYY